MTDKPDKLDDLGGLDAAKGWWAKRTPPNPLLSTIVTTSDKFAHARIERLEGLVK